MGSSVLPAYPGFIVIKTAQSGLSVTFVSSRRTYGAPLFSADYKAIIT
jgi:hypothetical protein